MPVSRLAHYSIRTPDLEASCRFYERVLGFRRGYRPPFDFPGAWLYLGDDEADYGTVHLIGIDPANPNGLAAYLGDKPVPAAGTGTVDHIAFVATGVEELLVVPSPSWWENSPCAATTSGCGGARTTSATTAPACSPSAIR